MNVSINLELIGNVIQNDNFSHKIIDHPMKPFGMRYWRSRYGPIPDTWNIFRGIDDFLARSPQVCSWLRDQEYMVDFKYYENLELPDGNLTNYLHVFPKVRSVRINELTS